MDIGDEHFQYDIRSTARFPRQLNSLRTFSVPLPMAFYSVLTANHVEELFIPTPLVDFFGQSLYISLP